MEDLHEHPAEMKIHPADDLVALGFGIPVTEGQGQVLEAHLAMPRIDPIQDPGHEVRQCVRLLDGQYLRECDHEPGEHGDQVVEPGAADLLAGHVRHSVDARDS